MPQIQKVFRLELTPEQFLNNCSSEELQELELLLGKPQYQRQHAGEFGIKVNL